MTKFIGLSGCFHGFVVIGVVAAGANASAAAVPVG